MRILRLYRVLVAVQLLLLVMVGMRMRFWKGAAATHRHELAALSLHVCTVDAVDAETGERIAVIKRYRKPEGKYPLAMRIITDADRPWRVNVEWVAARPVECVFGSDGYTDTPAVLGRGNCEHFLIYFHRAAPGVVVTAGLPQPESKTKSLPSTTPAHGAAESAPRPGSGTPRAPDAGAW